MRKRLKRFFRRNPYDPSFRQWWFEHQPDWIFNLWLRIRYPMSKINKEGLDTSWLKEDALIDCHSALTRKNDRIEELECALRFVVRHCQHKSARYGWWLDNEEWIVSTLDLSTKHNSSRAHVKKTEDAK
jgi:hypothetical protein